MDDFRLIWIDFDDFLSIKDPIGIRKSSRRPGRPGRLKIPDKYLPFGTDYEEEEPAGMLHTIYNIVLFFFLFDFIIIISDDIFTNFG